ncbi:glycoside hydrolase superfamily [Paraphoma chrysanthemicola]|uniref:Glycoside hydrolase superfamily n=1 Tax=Paraphoma chrysanthemicola TaxID=798071 RepID=A0A8K0RHU4_9PLEO|nr:glycoside hydrolase superfamily [Paraphoma chrysanthemicola]
MTVLEARSSFRKVFLPGLRRYRQIPHLKRLSRGHHLIVHGEPFLMLPAELHNSSFSCPNFMQQVWPKLKDSNINTVLANVSWEDIEPQEGHFDFTRLDQLLHDARANQLYLVLLWFGAFKNGKSTYAPGWVKTNPKRFPRMMIRTPLGGRKVADVLSIFEPAVVEADAAAFKALLCHIRDIDHAHSTVLMVQVENEVGLLGDSRDASPTATARFNAPVPVELIDMIRTRWPDLHPSLKQSLLTFQQEYQFLEAGITSWPHALGDSSATDELFMAYHYAVYVEEVARAGKSEYPLPMFTNVWQNYADADTDKSQPVVVGGGGRPGDYPSGGAVINVLDVWQHFAPSLDFVAPDLYLNDYNAVCAKYCHAGQPLFIPEQRRDDYGARRVWSAYATYGALGASPFAIDSLDESDNPWRRHFGLLAQVSSSLLAARESNNDTYGFWFDEPVQHGQSAYEHHVVMGAWRLTIERSFVFGQQGSGFGMVVQLSESRFLLVGEGFQVRFASTRKESTFSGILSFVERERLPGTKQMVTGRSLNGDETRSGEVAIMPAQRPDLGFFPICITIPARTGVAEVEVYEF